MNVRTISEKVFWNTVVQVFGKVVTTILSLLITAVLARALGVYGYGELTTSFAFLVFFGVIADFGFFQILVRELARQPKLQDQITNNILTIRIIFGFLVYLLATLLVWFFPYDDVVKQGVAVLALASFFLSINGTLIAVFQVHHRMDRPVISDVLGRVVLLALVLMAVWFDWGLVAIFTLYAMANFVTLTVNMWFIQPLVRLRLRFEPTQWRSLFRETWTMGIVAMLVILYFKLDTVLLSLYKGPLEVGLYGIPYKVLEILILIPGIFVGNLLPALTRFFQDGHEKARHIIQAGFDSLAILVLGIAVGIILIPQSIIGIVAGPEFVQTFSFQLGQTPITAPILLIILSVALVFIFLSHLWSIVLIAQGRQEAMIRPALIALVLNVGLNMIFIPIGSYLAAAIITVLTEVYIYFATARLAQQMIGYQISYQRLGRAMIAGIIMAVAVWPLRTTMILWPILVGILVYGGSLVALRAVPHEVLDLVRRKHD